MSNPWFRMYSEFAHDPKVQMLDEVMQRRYVMLMCLRCSNALVTLHETEVAFALRISEANLAETKALFIAKGFIDSGWNLLNWEKRQFSSDSSAARVAEHRRRKKEEEEAERNGDVTLQKRQGNALDTEQNRTDKKKTSATKVSGEPVGFAEFWSVYPNRKAKANAVKAWVKVPASLHSTIHAAVLAQMNSADWRKDGGQFIPHAASWLNAQRWEDELAFGKPTLKAVIV